MLSSIARPVQHRSGAYDRTAQIALAGKCAPRSCSPPRPYPFDVQCRLGAETRMGSVDARPLGPSRSRASSSQAVCPMMRDKDITAWKRTFNTVSRSTFTLNLTLSAIGSPNTPIAESPFLHENICGTFRSEKESAMVTIDGSFLLGTAAVIQSLGVLLRIWRQARDGAPVPQLEVTDYDRQEAKPQIASPCMCGRFTMTIVPKA